jgi:hypothetical protein
MLLIVDNVLPLPSLTFLQKEVVERRWNPNAVRYNNLCENKIAIDKTHFEHGPFRNHYDHLETVALDVLRRMFKELTVNPDPNGRGCGLHILPENGFLDLHYDGNWHPELNQLRFANMVFYVLGGESEFHINDLVVPFVPNRMVIFTTTHKEVHGVPRCVSIPRYTLSSFFYTPGNKPDHVHRAVFPNALESFRNERSALS